MEGKWERKSDTLWTYRIAGAARPYGSVVQYKDAGRSDAAWDALVTAGPTGDETVIAERVSFDATERRLSSTLRSRADE